MIRRFLAIFSLCLAVALPAYAADAFTAAQKSEIETMIKDYITAHPETMISSVESYYKKTQSDNNSAQEGRIENAPVSLMNDPNSPTIGPKNAKVAFVEFFDYNCGYCKQASPDLERIVNEYKDRVKFIFKELPILTDSSKIAARYALAANKQGKYWEFHSRVMLHQGPIDERYLEATAKDAGVDTDKLKKELDSADIIDQLSKTVDLARALGVRGTPYFVIGKEKLPGAISYDQMKVTLDKELAGDTTAAAAVAPATTAAAPSPSIIAPTAPAPAAPTATAATATTTTNDPLKGTGPTDNVADDPDVKAEIARARAETSAMVEEIKKQAEEIKKQAVEANAKATAAAEAQTKAAAAKK